MSPRASWGGGVTDVLVSHHALDSSKSKTGHLAADLV